MEVEWRRRLSKGWDSNNAQVASVSTEKQQEKCFRGAWGRTRYHYQCDDAKAKNVVDDSLAFGSLFEFLRCFLPFLVSCGCGVWSIAC